MPLDSPKWAELSHAYGKAIDTPNLLQQLYEVPPTEPIPKELSEKLWSSICHQGDGHTASYAAVPHITVIAGERAPADRTMHIALISSIEQGRHLKRSPAIPILLAEPYFNALKQCETLVLQCLVLKWDEIDYRYLVSALTTFHGFIGLAQMLEIAQATTECPECQAVFVTPGYELLIDPADLSHGTKLFQGHQSNVY